LTGFDGYVGSLCTSRSFALIVLHDARGHASDVDYVAPQEPASVFRTYEQLARRAERASSPLNDEIPDGADLSERAWHAANTSRFIASTRLLERRNARSDSEMIETLQDVVELGATWKLVEVGWKQLHNYDLEVEVTDPKYVNHLVEGQLFATTAFDAWDEDGVSEAPAHEPLGLREYTPGLIRRDD
jgi:hypothetical protein